MLYVVPIIHSPEDLGSLAHSVTRVKQSIGTDSERSRAGVREFWAELFESIKSLSLNFTQLKVYQDALPVAGEELIGIEQQIIDDLAAKGSRNHQILQWLRSQGAVILGTESPALLIEEYRIMKEMLERDAYTFDNPYEAIQLEILRSRDAFIADRIDKTLSDSQTGMIFLGLLHQLEDHLPSSIFTIYPFGRPIRPAMDL